MIADHIRNAAKYKTLSPAFKTAFEFIDTAEFKSLPLGKHLIRDEDLFVIIMEYDARDPKECRMEKHEKYIDIQLMLEGEERMAVKTFANQPTTIAYEETSDVAFYEDDHDWLLTLSQGQFAIFFTHDMHRPSMKTDKATKVRKAVFKIRTGT